MSDGGEEGYLGKKIKQDYLPEERWISNTPGVETFRRILRNCHSLLRRIDPSFRKRKSFVKKRACRTPEICQSFFIQLEYRRGSDCNGGKRASPAGRSFRYFITTE